MIPERFCTQIPQRMWSLINAMEPIAREKDLLTSFALMAAMPILIIPLERVAKKDASGKNEINDLHVAPRFAADWGQKRREKFVNAFVPNREDWSKWRYLVIPRNQIERPSAWKDALGRHPMHPGAVNEITEQDVENVLLVMRHGLAHGSIVYLDEDGNENPFRRVTHLGFVARAQGKDRGSATSFRVLIVEQEAFLSFLKRWTDWIGGYEVASSLGTMFAA